MTDDGGGLDPTLEPSIFVCTSALNEDDLANTVESAYSNATNPDRVFFGIFEQRTDYNFANVSRFPGVKKVDLTYREPYQQPLGLGLGRLGAFMLHEHQDFVLQIDAHTIFDKSWDCLLIEDLMNVMAIHPRSMISTRPKHYEYINGSIVKYDRTCRMGLRLSRNHPNGWAEILEADIPGPPFPEYVEHFLIAGGFVFAPRQLFDEILHDPRMPFGGEEHLFSLRACTRGWKIFSVSDSHLYTLSKEFHDYNDLPDEHFLGKTRPWKSMPPRLTQFDRPPCINFLTPIEHEESIYRPLLRGEEFGYWGAPDKTSYEQYINNLGFDYRLP